jgi:hypothetical protein
VETAVLGGLALGADVDVAGWVFAHKHHSKTGTNAPANEFLSSSGRVFNLAGGNGLPINQQGLWALFIHLLIPLDDT